MRSEHQKSFDCAAVLFLFDCVNRHGDIGGNLKVQKVVFLYELRGQENGFRAAHYRFFRYNQGPYSKDLANDVLKLKELGFITASNQLTARGRFLVEYVAPYLQNDKSAKRSLDVLDGVCKEYGKLSGWRLMNKVYAMTVPVIDFGNGEEKVKDVPFLTDILDPIENAELKEISPFPEDVLADLTKELAMPASELDPQNPAVRQAVIQRLQEIGLADFQRR